MQRPVESGQYTSFKLAEHLDRDGIAASIGSVGDAYDNALMESTIGLYKTELIKPRRPWKSLSQVELATAEWADSYNHRRLHGEIGHVPPVEYEANHSMESTKPQVTTTVRDLYRTRGGSSRPTRHTGLLWSHLTARQDHSTTRALSSATTSSCVNWSRRRRDASNRRT
ncbi:integrase core domain-containing protein [Streptomyces sp. 2A115]|uniref:integrase core domain-containing protein n=1 Tax=Streptomyces sp. 2A115 TaxID=3457439 RepID=UPI003FD1435A